MKKNILIVVDNLVVGGVTKVLANMLNSLDYEKFNIDLLILHYNKTMDVNIPKSVKIIKGNYFFSVLDEPIQKLIKEKNIFKIFHKFVFALLIKTNLIKFFIKYYSKKHITEKYDIAIGFCDGFSHLYTAYSNIPYKIAWLHSDIKVMNYSSRYIKVIKKALKKINITVSVSDEVGLAYKEIYNIEKNLTIPNLIDDINIIEKSKAKIDLEYSKDTINIVSVGRLDYSKNYEMLAQTHKKLLDDGYNICTYIVGDGVQKSALQNLIANLHIEDSFILLGQKQNPYPYIKNADLFALSSRYEGLPTVILEALCLHVPCISTNVAGVASVLKSDFGIITDNNEDDFYINFKKIMEDKKLLKLYKTNLSNYKYDNTKILNKIEYLLLHGGKNE